MKKFKPAIVAIVAVAAVVCCIIAYSSMTTCDLCDKKFFGTGYEPSIVNKLSSPDTEEICKECAEKVHSVAILQQGKTVEDFRLDKSE